MSHKGGQQVAGFGFPDLSGAVRARRCQLDAVGTEGNGVNGLPMSGLC